jgi:hypothetical protein
MIPGQGWIVKHADRSAGDGRQGGRISGQED